MTNMLLEPGWKTLLMILCDVCDGMCEKIAVCSVVSSVCSQLRQICQCLRVDSLNYIVFAK